MFSIFKTKFYYSKIFISVFCAILFFAVLAVTVKAQVVNRPSVTGWAWSDTIGWIKFDTGRADSVTYDRTTGTFYGYAWSDNIGWIKFDGLSANGGVGGNGARANTSSGIISGWARACAGTLSGNCANMNSRSDGWDGWIKFDTGRTNPVRIDLATGDFHGYAWGSDVVGWISFNCVEGGSNAGNFCGSSPYKVTIGPPGSHNLNVTINTPNCGTGTVVSNPSGINCSSGTCSAPYNQNQQVTLTATPTNGSSFTGWTGIASCVGLGPCSITIGNTDTNVVANFSKASCSSVPSSSSSSSSTGGNSSTANLSVIYAGSGTGSASLQHMGSLEPNTDPDYPFDINVPGNSPWNLALNKIFKITATPGVNSSFGSWSISSGSCDTSQGANTCILTMNADKVVTVTFNCVSNCGGGGGNTLTVNVGSGTVTVVADDGSPTLVCSNFATCSRSYSSSASVTLTASQTGAGSFTSWGQDCSFESSDTCNLTMSNNRTVDAYFSDCSCVGNSCVACVPPPPPPPPPPPINGACGSAHKTNRKNAPQGSELCNEGGASPVTTTSSGWDWTCSGINGGIDAVCHAGKLEVIIEEI